MQVPLLSLSLLGPAAAPHSAAKHGDRDRDDRTRRYGLGPGSTPQPWQRGLLTKGVSGICAPHSGSAPFEKDAPAHHHVERLTGIAHLVDNVAFIESAREGRRKNGLRGRRIEPAQDRCIKDALCYAALCAHGMIALALAISMASRRSRASSVKRGPSGLRPLRTRSRS